MSELALQIVSEILSSAETRPEGFTIFTYAEPETESQPIIMSVRIALPNGGAVVIFPDGQWKLIGPTPPAAESR